MNDHALRLELDRGINRLNAGASLEQATRGLDPVIQPLLTLFAALGEAVSEPRADFRDSLRRRLLQDRPRARREIMSANLRRVAAVSGAAILFGSAASPALAHGFVEQVRTAFGEPTGELIHGIFNSGTDDRDGPPAPPHTQTRPSVESLPYRVAEDGPRTTDREASLIPGAAPRTEAGDTVPALPPGDDTAPRPSAPLRTTQGSTTPIHGAVRDDGGDSPLSGSSGPDSAAPSFAPKTSPAVSSGIPAAAPVPGDSPHVVGAAASGPANDTAADHANAAGGNPNAAGGNSTAADIHSTQAANAPETEKGLGKANAVHARR